MRLLPHGASRPAARGELKVCRVHRAPIQTFPGAHPASYTMGTGSFPGVKLPERGVNHPPLTSVEVNSLTPNDSYMGPTAPLTSKGCISYIYSTNIGTEYFKYALYSPFFLFKMQFVS